jgi:hypothetical protein
LQHVPEGEGDRSQKGQERSHVNRAHPVTVRLASAARRNSNTRRRPCHLAPLLDLAAHAVMANLDGWIDPVPDCRNGHVDQPIS